MYKATSHELDKKGQGFLLRDPMLIVSCLFTFNSVHVTKTLLINTVFSKPCNSDLSKSACSIINPGTNEESLHIMSSLSNLKCCPAVALSCLHY